MWNHPRMPPRIPICPSGRMDITVPLRREKKEVASAASFFMHFYNPSSVRKRGLVLQFFCTFTQSFNITGMPSRS